MNNNFIIISLLDGKGATGVETHFNQLVREAHAYGIDGLLVSPYPCEKIWAKCARVVARALRLVHRELAEVLVRSVNSKVIEGKLKAILSSRTGQRAPITLYAQDPLSATTALRIRKKHHCRVVTVIHYNVSEADELVMQGKAKQGGALWRFVASTERTALPAVDQIIFVSEFMRRVVLGRLPKAARVPNTVIPNFSATAPQSGMLTTITRDMISIGTLEPRKNQAFLLQVLARTNSMGGPYTLTLVGNGPDRSRLEALARELGVEDQVTFVGFRENAARLIAQHRILVHAARVENLPITLIEALAVGRPILAPAVGGITEIFSHGVEGYYWPLDDIARAATLLVHTLSDAATYHRLSQAALGRYQEKFESRRLVGIWLQTILDRGGALLPTKSSPSKDETHQAHERP